MSIKLDKTRDYSPVFPPLGDAHHMQNGFYFDVDGELVTGEHKEEGGTVVNFLDEKNAVRLKRLSALEADSARRSPCAGLQRVWVPASVPVLALRPLLPGPVRAPAAVHPRR